MTAREILRLVDPPRVWLATLILAVIGILSPDAEAARGNREPAWIHSGVHPGFGETVGVRMAFSRRIRRADAPWLRLRFGDYRLGDSSLLRIQSLEDGGTQHLDAHNLPRWGNASAYFNGDEIQVDLFVGPEDDGAYFTIEEVWVGARSPGDGEFLTICGSGDDRVPSSHPAVGRFTWDTDVDGTADTPNCTAWIASNGALVTAGHCMDPLGDGDLDRTAADVIEFNVPLSDDDGTWNLAQPEDQYPIDPSTVIWRYDGPGQGLGKDWAVFDVSPNSETGRMPAIAGGGFHRVTRSNPEIDSTVRVTGFGTDASPPGASGFGNERNVTQQTLTALYLGEQSASSGSDWWHEYYVDTTGGNSGSPILSEDNAGYAIGVHTNGGCDANLTDSNKGTSFEVDALEDALQDFHGPETVYVDVFDNPLSGFEDGTIFFPYARVLTGLDEAAPGAVLSIVAGVYEELVTFSKPMRVVAPVGTVRIGGP